MIIEEYAASIGWLLGFKERHGLTFLPVCGEKADVDTAARKEWLSGKLKNRLASDSLDDVFNVDESTQYYKQLPNKALNFQGDDRVGSK